MRMAVQSGETTGGQVSQSSGLCLISCSHMRGHGMSAPWPGRKKETSCELQDSLQETSRKAGWAKCQELVSIGISSCWSLRSSCRAGWLDCLTSFYQHDHFYFARAILCASSDFFSRFSVLLQSSWAAHSAQSGLLFSKVLDYLYPYSVSGFCVYHVPKELSFHNCKADPKLLYSCVSLLPSVTYCNPLGPQQPQSQWRLMKHILYFLNFLAHLLYGKHTLKSTTTRSSLVFSQDMMFGW